MSVGPIDVPFPHDSPTTRVCHTAIAYSDIMFKTHLADSRDYLQNLLDGLGIDVLQKFELGNDEQTRRDQIMEGFWVRIGLALTLSQEELHVIITNIVNIPINRAI